MAIPGGGDGPVLASGCRFALVPSLCFKDYNSISFCMVQ